MTTQPGTTVSPATAITGKSVTFAYGGHSGTAQITSATVDESGSSETIQTLGGSVAVSQGVESKVSADFLYDGDQPGGGFYGALKAALDSGNAGALEIDAKGSGWTGQAVVTSLSAEMPADGAVTCSAEVTISGALRFAPPASGGPVEITGVQAGTPGTFQPVGFTPLSGLGALEADAYVGNAGTAKPGAAWTTGQYVLLGDSSEAHWDGTKWAVGKAS
jgi:hypothetical protein